MNIVVPWCSSELHFVNTMQGDWRVGRSGALQLICWRSCILVFFLMTQDAQFLHREVFEADGRHDLYKHRIKFQVTRISSTASSNHPLWCFFLTHMYSWSIEPILLSSILAGPPSERAVDAAPFGRVESLVQYATRKSYPQREFLHHLPT